MKHGDVVAEYKGFKVVYEESKLGRFFSLYADDDLFLGSLSEMRLPGLKEKMHIYATPEDMVILTDAMLADIRDFLKRLGEGEFEEADDEER